MVFSLAAQRVDHCGDLLVVDSRSGARAWMTKSVAVLESCFDVPVFEVGSGEVGLIDAFGTVFVFAGWASLLRVNKIAGVHRYIERHMAQMRKACISASL